MIRLIKNNCFWLVILAIIILFTFWGLPRTFFQQDEWQTLGHYLSVEEGKTSLFQNYNFLHFLLGEGRLLTRLINFPLIKTAFNYYWIISVFSILFHTINSILVFALAKKISKKDLLSFLAAVFFAVNGVSQQAVIWYSAAIVNLPSTTFILLSILSYLKFLEKNKKFLFYSFFFLFISLCFKESGIFLIAFFPILHFLYTKKPAIRKTLRANLIFIIYGALVVFFRIGELFFASKKIGVFIQKGEAFKESILLHLILYPLTGLSQVFIPPLTLYSWTRTITKIQYSYLVNSPLIGLISETITADLLSILLSGFLLLILFLLFRKEKETKVILFALALVFTSFLPYAVLNRSFSYLESRYYYIASVGGGIIFASIIIWFLKIKKSKVLGMVVLTLSIFYLFYQMTLVQAEIKRQVNLGRERLAILNTIKREQPQLTSNKNIFYITSDQDFYIENMKIPFQQGPGYTLMVWYNDSGKIPAQFLKGEFLWGMIDQGYKEIDGKGFGYFWDLDKMAKAIADNNLSTDAVHAYFYDAKNKHLINNTEEIKQKIATISAGRK